tara:strand:- start:302 stop:871 length:570 start_codon:yes stop_codon:yes gene_type:complete
MSQYNAQSLSGHFLMAMPTMPDPRFERTVIYMCAHSPSLTMGIVINKILDNLNLNDILEQFEIDAKTFGDELNIHFGGPVETSRGFVLHSTDYQQEDTLVVDEQVSLTTSINVLRHIAEGKGPSKYLLALGCAGWAPGQLDSEIQANGWLHAPADLNIIFDTVNTNKWSRAVGNLGFDIGKLSNEAGHA